MAKELVQLAFIKLWQFRHTLSDNYTLDTQLFNIASSTLIDYLRQQSTLRKKIVTLSEDTSKLVNAPAPETGNSFEYADYLHSAMQSLSPVRKKVFILSRIYGHSYKEISHQLSISVKTVEDHMAKALKQIRAMLT